MMKRQRMVKVSVEVGSGTARYMVGVRAQTIRKALSVVGDRYPRGEVRVVFPVEAEGSFSMEPSAPAGIAGHEHVQAA